MTRGIASKVNYDEDLVHVQSSEDLNVWEDTEEMKLLRETLGYEINEYKNRRCLLYNIRYWKWVCRKKM